MSKLKQLARELSRHILTYSAGLTMTIFCFGSMVTEVWRWDLAAITMGIALVVQCLHSKKRHPREIVSSNVVASIGLTLAIDGLIFGWVFHPTPDAILVLAALISCTLLYEVEVHEYQHLRRNGASTKEIASTEMGIAILVMLTTCAALMTGP